MKTRTRNFKRLLSWLLCLCMVAGLLPPTALAEGSGTEDDPYDAGFILYDNGQMVVGSPPTWQNNENDEFKLELNGVPAPRTDGTEGIYSITLYLADDSGGSGLKQIGTANEYNYNEQTGYEFTWNNGLRDPNNPSTQLMPDGTYYVWAIANVLDTGGQFLKEVYYNAGQVTVRSSTNTGTIDMTVSRNGETVTKFANTDTITITANVPSGLTNTPKVSSVFFGETSIYVGPNDVEISGTKVSITLHGLYKAVYDSGTDTVTQGALLSPGSGTITFYDDGNGSTAYTSKATYSVTGEGGTGNNTCSVSFATDPNFENPVTSVTPSSTEYYVRATDFSPALPYGGQYGVMIKATGSSAVYTLTGTPSSEQDASGNTAYLQRGPIVFQLGGQNTEPAAGTYDLTVSVYENAGMTGEPLYTYTSTNKMTVAAPTVSTPTINTGSLPNGVTGTAYSQTLKATPGTEDKAITWSVTSGRLPDGLTLDIGTGTISGTPTAAGNYTFTVTAKEADGGETSKFFTITITEAITSRELKVGSGSYSPGDRISVRWDMSAGVPEGGEATLTLHYTDTSSQAQTASYEMTRSPLGYFYAYVELPKGCASVQKLSATATISGQTVTAENSDLDITMKGKLILNWNDRLERMVTLEIEDEQSRNTFTHYLYSNSTSAEISLPAGEYTLSATISVIGMGDVSVLASPTDPITITNGATTTQKLTFSSMEVVTYRPKVERSDGGPLYSSGYSLYWYEDADGTKPLGVGYNYTAMADTQLYVKAVPTGTLSATHNATAVTQVTENMTLTLEAKPANTVTVTVQCADVAGGGTTPLTKVGGTVVLSQPGDDGTTKTTQQWVYSYKPNQVTFTGVTEGSTITFTPNDQYLCGPVSKEITSLDGNQSNITLNAEQLQGVITLNLTVNYEKSTSHPFLSGFYNLTVKKGDTDIPFHRVGNNYLVLDDLNGLNSSTELTISGQYGSGDFPTAVFTTDVTLSGNKFSATADITMDARGQVVIFTTSREVAVADLLLYQNGKLYYTKGSYITSSTFVGSDSKRSSWSVRLPAGSYTVYVVDRDYLSTVDPETYQTTPSFEAGTYDSASFTIEDKTTQYVNLNAPGIVQSHADVNYEMSSVTGTEDFPGTLTHTTLITLTSNEKLDESRGISLKLYHHQFGGQVSIRSLAINGVPWTKSSGTGLNGRLDLTLDGADLERYGGFPLRISYVIARSDYSELDFESYLFYTNDAGESRTARVGTFYQEGGDVVLNVPSMVGEKTFFVSGYIPEWGRDVTIYLDGAAVATVQSGSILDSDGSVARYSATGYFAAQVTLPEDVEEFDTFRVSAAWEEGVSEDREVMYTATTGVLKCVTLTLNGKDFVLWENGNSVSESWNVFAQSSSTLSWKVEFFNPDKVKNVVVHVPRSDGSELELDASRVGSAFQTKTRTLYGAIPTGVYVTFDTELTPLAKPHTGELTDGVMADTAKLLNQSQLISEAEAITNLTGNGIQNGTGISFYLDNGNGKDTDKLPVSVAFMDLDWENGEVEALEQDRNVTGTGSDTLLYVNAGYMEQAPLDALPDGLWTLSLVNKYARSDGKGAVYMLELYTASYRLVVTWDTYAKSKSASLMLLGNLKDYICDVAGDTGDERTLELLEVWMTVMDRYLTALTQAAETPGAGAASQTADTFAASAVTRSVGTFSAGPVVNLLPVFKPDKASVDSIRNLMQDPKWKQVEGAYKWVSETGKVGYDSFTWQDGAPLTAGEAKLLAKFYRANKTCLDYAYGLYKGAGTSNPYRVVAEFKAAYMTTNTNWLVKALETVSGGAGNSLNKQALDAIANGAKDFAIQKFTEANFGTQGQNLAYELYQATTMASREGGPCDKIEWDDFPITLYNSGKSLTTRSLPNTPRGTYDPSGYVYEAVPSNRVQGARVDLYTFNQSARAQEWVETDRYGISAKNPQITGEDGRYEWFVPEGYWRVVVTKDGYEPVDTGSSRNYGLKAQTVSNDPVSGRYWMPVLPVQLDVNIPLVSYTAPTVQKVEATTEGVYVTFSKYMVTTLNETDFKINGVAPAGVTLVNAEAASSAENAPEYASVFKLTYPANMEVSADDTINVYVGNTVTSYAGTEMGKTYTSDPVRVQEQLPPADAPELAAGMPETNSTVEKNTVVYLTVPAGAAVWYTTDGSDPAKEDNPSRKLYNAANGIIVDRTMTIKAVAVQTGKGDSTPLILNYNVEQELPEPPDEPDEPVIPDDPGDDGGNGGGNGGGGGGGGTSSSGSKVIGPGASKEKAPAVTVRGNGKVSIADDCVTLTFLPDQGYYLAALTVNGDKVTVPADGVYTLPYPCPCHTVLAVFEKGEAPVTNPFTDVNKGTWYYDAVLWAVANGVTNGTSATTFSPNAPVTRAQMVTFLWRAYGSPRATGSNPFADVSADAWYYDAVLWAVANGVTVGTSATTFSPDAPVTRSQAVTFQWRAAGSPVVAGDSFDDVAADAYYAGAVTWAVANGITNGTGGNKFSPEVTVTRAQAVTFLWRELA